MTKSLEGDDAVAPNAYRLLWAGFMAILAAFIYVFFTASASGDLTAVAIPAAPVTSETCRLTINATGVIDSISAAGCFV